jgi:YD repeat-containing protein
MNFRQNVIRIFFLLAFLVIASNLFAGVNLKNGNFYISYTDIVLTDRETLKIARTYNSKSTEVGIFGFGWGSDYETFLVENPDGSVVIYENGAGARTSFLPEGNELDVDEAVSHLIEKMRLDGEFANATEESELKLKLQDNEELRSAYLRKYANFVNFGSRDELPVKWRSNDRGLQMLSRTKAGYVRKYSDGRSDSFNKRGQLSRIDNRNSGSFTTLHYDGQYRLSRLTNSNGKSLRFFYGDDTGKFVRQIRSERNLATYEYDDSKNLVSSTDAVGNTYRFSYDDNHNLTHVRYEDGSNMTMEYALKTQFLEKITRRNGSSTEYSYESDPENPDFHYWTIVKERDFNGNLVANRYEYWIETKSSGHQYTSKILTRINGIETVTEYNAEFSLPTFIKRGDSETRFKYNSLGMLLKKESTDGELIELEYDSIHNKISKVTNNQGTTSFAYDKKGNLQFADKGKESQIELRYDWESQITDVITEEVKISLEYNPVGRPIKISLEGEGSIDVTYDRYGEIKNVESEAGHKMVQKVTQAYQRLSAKVEPVGVDLGL